MKKSLKRFLAFSVFMLSFFTYESIIAQQEQNEGDPSLCVSGTVEQNEGECDGTYCRWVADPDGCKDCRVPI